MIDHARHKSPQRTEFAFSTPHLYNKGEVFENCYQHPLVLRLVRHFLGQDATIMSLGDNAIEGRINWPGSAKGSGLGGSGLHTDGGATGAYQPPVRRWFAHSLAGLVHTDDMILLGVC